MKSYVQNSKIAKLTFKFTFQQVMTPCETCCKNVQSKQNFVSESGKASIIKEVIKRKYKS